MQSKQIIVLVVARSSFAGCFTYSCEARREEMGVIFALF
jgi:hypothetical protein